MAMTEVLPPAAFPARSRHLLARLRRASECANENFDTLMLASEV